MYLSMPIVFLSVGLHFCAWHRMCTCVCLLNDFSAQYCIVLSLPSLPPSVRLCFCLPPSLLFLSLCLWVFILNCLEFSCSVTHLRMSHAFPVTPKEFLPLGTASISSFTITLCVSNCCILFVKVTFESHSGTCGSTYCPVPFFQWNQYDTKA